MYFLFSMIPRIKLKMFLIPLFSYGLIFSNTQLASAQSSKGKNVTILYPQQLQNKKNSNKFSI